MKKALIAIVLATSIQGGFAGNVIVNPFTNPDLSPKARAHLESRILEWLCPRIKMTASNYIRSRLGPRIPQIKMMTRNYIRTHLFELQLWLERLPPAQKQKLDNALMESVAAYLKTHPNDFMVSCYIDNTTQNLGDGEMIYPQADVFTINADAGDTVTFPSNQGGVPASPNFFCEPFDTWYQPNYMNPFYFICKGGYTSISFNATFFWDISSVTYSHGGKQIVLTQKNPVFWSN
jgi:hypothetical protein